MNVSSTEKAAEYSRFGLLMMNRCWRNLGLTIFLTGLNNTAFAICEKEIEQLVSDSYNREVSKPVVSRDK